MFKFIKFWWNYYVDRDINDWSSLFSVVFFLSMPFVIVRAIINNFREEMRVAREKRNKFWTEWKKVKKQ